MFRDENLFHSYKEVIDSSLHVTGHTSFKDAYSICYKMYFCIIVIRYSEYCNRDVVIKLQRLLPKIREEEISIFT